MRRIVGCIIDPGDLTELVRGAFGRTPPLSATLGGWHDLELLQRATQQTRGQDTTERVVGLLAPARDPSQPVSPAIDRLWVATQHDSWRVERNWHRASGSSGTSVHVSDGVTTWLPTFSGVFHAHPADPDAFPARNLLDPSWLAGYDYDTAQPGTHNDRDILEMHGHLAAAPAPAPRGRTDRKPSTVLRLRPPADVEVLIDTKYGFLHRMTGLIDSQPFVVEELLDIVLDPPLDEWVFRIDKTRFEVFDRSEWGPDGPRPDR